MAQQILGSLQNIEVDVAGGSSYKNLVCLSSSSVNTTLDTATDQTNCGVLTSVGEPSVSVDFDAVCEVAPTVSQISYEDLLAASINKTLVSVRVQSPTVTGASVGTVYYHQFSAYVTSLTLTQATADFIKFSGSLSSTGTIDITA
jgi:hypothetical protein